MSVPVDASKVMVVLKPEDVLPPNARIPRSLSDSTTIVKRPHATVSMKEVPWAVSTIGALMKWTQATVAREMSFRLQPSQERLVTLFISSHPTRLLLLNPEGRAFAPVPLITNVTNTVVLSAVKRMMEKIVLARWQSAITFPREWAVRVTARTHRIGAVSRMDGLAAAMGIPWIVLASSRVATTRRLQLRSLLLSVSLGPITEIIDYLLLLEDILII